MIDDLNKKDDWYDKAWKKCQWIKIDSKMVAGNKPLLNFPLLFTNTDADYSKYAQKTGNDFLFTLSDGKTKLDHEIQFWDPSIGRLVAYVKIPVFSPTEDTLIYLYYGNLECDNQSNPDGVWGEYSYRQNFSHDPQYAFDSKENEVTDEMGIPLKLKFFITQKIILEELFGLKWFNSQIIKKSTHPALKRWKLCNKMIEQKGRFQLPYDEPIIPEITQLTIENLAFIECSKGDVSTFSLGSIANYGDVLVQKRLRNELKSPNKYLDIQTELQYAAWAYL